jgi:aryl sulfotransferase
MTGAWPRKTREIHNHHFDSTVWNDFAFRDDDVVIATYAKSGTTWTQQIVGQLLFGGAADVPVNELSPWLDLRVPPAAEKIAALAAQTHRRFIKTHLPVDALVYSPRAKYLYVARDGRDVLWSLFHHHANANADFYATLNDTPGRVGPAIARPTDDVRAYFLDWLARDGFPFWPFWENVRSWWAIRDLPNLLLVHFADLKADPESAIRRIADFLAVPIYPDRWPAILEHCSFEWMKRHADLSAPLGGAVWEGGAPTFINQGTNGRWRDVLTAEDIARYETTAERELGPECARWLAAGTAGSAPLALGAKTRTVA